VRKVEKCLFIEEKVEKFEIIVVMYTITSGTCVAVDILSGPISSAG
jgi:hypothetical protein